MRPENEVSGEKLHECSDCGRRVTNPDGRVCDRCGGKLINISRERDL